jgi:hypothetical protein
MEAKELKVGFWTEWNNIQSQVTLADFCEQYETGQCFFHKLPIPVTEEWIDRLNEKEFDFCGYGTRIIYQSIKFPAIKYELSQNIIAVYFNDEMINIVNYVHEWQDVHLALTREELNFN